MKFKLDENLGSRIVELVREAGHDVSTVYEQELHGATDNTLYDICLKERRCLVSLDLDFSNVLRFPPEQTTGIVVLRPPGKALRTMLTTLARQLIEALNAERLEGRLWIVEYGRIRIHQPSESDLHD